MKRYFIYSSVLALCFLVACSFYMCRLLSTPMSLPAQGFPYTMEPGSSVARAAWQLHQQGILEHPRWLIAFARLTGRTKVITGEYLIASGASPFALLDQLQSGDVRRYQLTLVEGWTFFKALDYLHQQQKIKPLLKDLPLAEQLVKLKVEQTHPEGWFFPDTYSYTANTSDIEILRRAYEKMQDVLSREWESRAESLPYKDAYEALIMASIVERETGQPSEREQIAGVFLRRLEKNMRLQTDPTVIYGLGPAFDGNIRRRHLKQATPYNTYVIKGLPPTPIALPGREAIHAALHPDNGNALYFVAKGDGSHYFSSSLEEHNKAVKQFQIYRRVKNYRSAPAQ